MRELSAIFGFGLLAIVVADAFQTVIVARHSQKMPGVTRMLYQLSWIPFAAAARLIKSEGRREKYLGIYGPLSLLMLLSFWAASLIAAFAMFQWSVDLHLNGSRVNFADGIYFSAATFFTLGSAEPQNLPSKYLMVLEAGFGFTFLGLVIGYLPVLYQSFSSRELRILLLDARAGSPPSAAEFLLRRGPNPAKLEERLADWEEWALGLLQNHLSYPMLAYYRSQHTNQSWLAALTAVLDISALVMLSSEDDLKRQAEFTFAAGRHAVVHTASTFRMRPHDRDSDRLPADDFSRLRDVLSAGSTPLRPERISESELRKLRAMYEPHAYALAAYFLMDLPAWFPSKTTADSWRATSWEP
ncbi:hypothetical protein SAMN05519104_5377 [Rhizobiales bacterium GAS188]|nr:hypothetical protein SAMN05519104_5377 [Rhizobiales bacterium GAS188]